MEAELASLGGYWYLGAILVQLALVQFVRKSRRTAAHWQKIPNGWRAVPGFLFGASAGFAEALASGSTPKEAGIAAVLGIFKISVPAMGIAAALKESHIPWDGGAGGRPRKVLAEA